MPRSSSGLSPTPSPLSLMSRLPRSPARSVKGSVSCMKAWASERSLCWSCIHYWSVDTLLILEDSDSWLQIILILVVTYSLNITRNILLLRICIESTCTVNSHLEHLEPVAVPPCNPNIGSQFRMLFPADLASVALATFLAVHHFVQCLPTLIGMLSCWHVSPTAPDFRMIISLSRPSFLDVSRFANMNRFHSLLSLSFPNGWLWHSRYIHSLRDTNVVW